MNRLNLVNKRGLTTTFTKSSLGFIYKIKIMYFKIVHILVLQYLVAYIRHNLKSIEGIMHAPNYLIIHTSINQHICFTEKMGNFFDELPF